MAKVKFGSTKRYGVRYGHTLRNKLGKIEAQQKKKHECPYCAYAKVKWQSVGIYNCTNCKAVFTGRAYAPEIRKDISTRRGDSIVRARKVVAIVNEDDE